MDPRVAVEHPSVPHVLSDVRVVVDDLLHVTCSECGDLTDYETNDEDGRHRLQRIAKTHAEETHDGLVDAVGWAR